MHLDAPIDSLIRHTRNQLVLPYITPNSSICDIGCSENPVLLKTLSKTITWGVGLDYSIPAACMHKNLRFYSVDLNTPTLPLTTAQFDFVTMLAVLEHLENPHDIIRECFRILKKGGQLLLTTPAPKSQKILEFFADLRLISHKEIYDHKHYFSKLELFNLLRQNQFTAINIHSKALGLNTLATGTKL